MKALFNERKFQDLSKNISLSIDNQIKQLGKKDFENSTIPELVDEILLANKTEIPKLLEEEIYMKNPEDTKISVDGHRYGGRTIDGTKFTFVIPFKGDSHLFDIFPTTSLNVLPFAQKDILDLKVVLKVPVGNDTSRLRNEFDQNLENINKYLGFLEDDFNILYARLPALIKVSLQKRKEKLDGDDAVVNSFGFPIK